MKLFQDSLLTLPIRLLMTAFPFLKTYYNGVANSPDAYEHFYTGFIAMLIAAVMSGHGFRSWHILMIVWFLHYVVKEVIVDGWNKHWIKKYIRKLPVGNGEMQSFLADTITRNAGFVFGLPFLILAILRHT